MTVLDHNGSPADTHADELADEDRLRIVFYNPMDYGDPDHPDPRGGAASRTYSRRPKPTSSGYVR